MYTSSLYWMNINVPLSVFFRYMLVFPMHVSVSTSHVNHSCFAPSVLTFVLAFFIFRTIRVEVARAQSVIIICDYGHHR
jgi:hypothetical protein